MNSGESSGRLIDDEGNVFHVVNVIDALVILLVLAVAVAGAALLLTGDLQPDEPTETTTTHVTLNLGPQPTYLVSEISEGDSFSPTQYSNLTVTAVHLAPADNRTYMLVGARIQGPLSDGRVQYAGEHLRLNRPLNINTSSYNTTGRVSDVGSEPTLETNTTTVVVRDQLPAAEAGAITVGDDISLGSRTIATVTDVAIAPRVDGRAQTVRVEAQLSTYPQLGNPYFGETEVRAGRELSLSTGTYAIDGRIEQVEVGLVRAGRTNRTVRLTKKGVSKEVAAIVHPGLTEQSGGRTTAYVTDVEVTPSPVVETTSNGTVVTGDHPTRRDLTLTTELQVSETATGPEFRGERLQHGSTVVLDLGTVTLEATVVGLES